MKRLITFCIISFGMLTASMAAEKHPADYVNPFVGTTNFGTTNPGAVCPNGMMSVVPFNVMGSEDNKYDAERKQRLLQPALRHVDACQQGSQHKSR